MAQRSMYELLNGANSAGNPDLALNAANSDFVLARQRLVWDFTSIRGNSSDIFVPETGGSSTVTMTSEGIRLLGYHASTNNVSAQIHLNDKRQYDPTDAVFIAGIKCHIETNGESHFAVVGLAGTDYNNQASLFRAHTQNANFEVYNGKGDVTVDTGIRKDFAWHTIKIQNYSSSFGVSVDGNLRVTVTGNIADTKQQPFAKVHHGYSGGSTSDCYINYVEVYNT